MLKRIMLALVVGGLALACILQNSYLQSTTKELLLSLDHIRTACEEGDLARAEREFSHMNDYWEEHADTLFSMLEHHEMDQILAELKSLGANIEYGAREFLPSNIARLAYYLDHISDWDKFTFYNIF